MRKHFTLYFIVGLMLLAAAELKAWEGMPTPRLKVDGRYLKDTHGNIVNLHGFAQTYSPWFNERGTKWHNYDVSGCLTYNQGLIDDILDVGWKMSFIRLHMDPYWSNTPGCQPDGHELPNCFNETRFNKYLDEVFIPMAEYAISKGMYVVMRPPGVSPEVIGVEDDYNYAQYLFNIWDIVSKHPRIKDREEIMFELANEPVRIRLADGSEGANTQAHFDVLKEIFQPIVNRIRDNGFQNVLWIPGSGYQAHYKGFAVNPIEGDNIGYAVHVYPGWFGSADGYDVFKREWDKQVKPIADLAPILITEMDWAPAHYESSWGKGVTGTAGAEGFGANFKEIMDETGNVGWLLFTDANLLAKFNPVAPLPDEPYTFLNDPEACPWPVYHWYLDYAELYEPRPDFEYIAELPTNDNFRHWNLRPQWSWYGSTAPEAWSLLERAGYMRLKNIKISGNITESYTILTQPIFAYPNSNNLSYGTVKLDIENMKDGDIAGLSVFMDEMNYIGVELVDGEKRIVSYINNNKLVGPLVSGNLVFLRSIVNTETGNVEFYYSTDNISYSDLGVDLLIEGSVFGLPSGCKFGLFNYATKETGGYVDFDWFSTEREFSEEKFYPGEFDAFTEESLTVTDLYLDEGELITMLTKGTKKLVVNAVFGDGRVEDVGLDAEYTIGNDEVISINNSIIRSFEDGESSLIIDYTDPLGKEMQINTNLHSTTFPLTAEFFNPDIWEKGSFDEATKTLKTGQWGFGGWLYDGIDLSAYKYIVVRLGGANTVNADFRLFDETSYWSSPAIFKFGDNQELIVRLKEAKKDNGAPLNPKNIYIAGFWSNGSNPFIIDAVFLSNSQEYDAGTSIQLPGISSASLIKQEYYTISGQRLAEINQVSGLFIVKQYFSDGTIKAVKMLKR